MISPVRWHELFRRRYAEPFGAVYPLGFGVHFHSDGHILGIVGDLMEIGADVINCQITVIDPSKFGPLVRGKPCLHSDLDGQHILPHGTPDDVGRHVRDIVGRFHGSGGPIGCGQIGPDVPPANVEAMFEASREHRGGRTGCRCPCMFLVLNAAC